MVTAMRAPVVAGVGGGVGTTTVAAALRGHDAGRVTAGWWPDILVCRGTLDSLRRAAAILETADPEAFPVLAVTLDAARAARGRSGHTWSVSNRTSVPWWCCRTCAGGRRSRTRWPRPHTCSQNRPIGYPGPCVRTPRRCGSWSRR